VTGAVARGDAVALVFGHAIYEGLVLGRASPLASVVCLPGSAHDERAARDAMIGHADRALAAVVTDRARLLDPKQMLRVRAAPGLLAGGSGAA
jgi:hypothetical protein